MTTTFTLPELGENIEMGTIANVLVSPGDSVTKNQSIVEVETDKAVVEVPAPADGTIRTVHVKPGDEIRVGDAIIAFDEAGDGAAAAPAPAKEAPKEEAAPSEPAPPLATPAEPPAPVETQGANGGSQPGEYAPTDPTRSVAAAPSVRRFARQIGVDLTQVKLPSGQSRLTMDDVKTHALNMNTTSAGSAPSGVAHAADPLPDFGRWGEFHREKMHTIRRRTAERLSTAWATIPHVTQQDKADVTDLEKFRKQYGPRAAAAGGKLTATAILVKTLASALKKFPQFNASADMESLEIIYKHYYNIGVAVDTDRGLLVPVINNVDTKNIVEIAVELNELAERARNHKLTLEQMQGGCITITNLGGIGGTSFTPIVNPPEVAILGVSRSSVEPVYKDGQFVPRTMLPLSLSYDHKIIDGADAARFTRWICEAIEQPFLLFLEG
jgi:pyruvate dehydrogenase E2 component (dihydrolipoamide acetyltransferase)